MAWETTVTAPSEANVGNEVGIDTLIECTGDCDSTDFTVDINGVEVYSANFMIVDWAFQLPLGEGQTDFDDWEIWDPHSLSRKYRATTTHNLGRDFHGVAV